MRMLIVIPLLASTILPSYAGYHHVIAAPVAKAVGSSGGSAGAAGSANAGAGLVAGFIFTVALIIVVHEIMGPPCARKGAKNGYDYPRLWRPTCLLKKRDPVRQVAVFSK